jgi:hypothetical protein
MNCNAYELIILILIAISIGFITFILVYFKTKEHEDNILERDDGILIYIIKTMF